MGRCLKVFNNREKTNDNRIHAKKIVDASITISAYLQLMNQAISIEEIQEYSKMNYQIAVSLSNRRKITYGER